jgi:hypothetical protein
MTRANGAFQIALWVGFLVLAMALGAQAANEVAIAGKGKVDSKPKPLAVTLTAPKAMPEGLKKDVKNDAKPFYLYVKGIKVGDHGADVLIFVHGEKAEDVSSDHYVGSLSFQGHHGAPGHEHTMNLVLEVGAKLKKLLEDKPTISLYCRSGDLEYSEIVLSDE